MGSTYQLSSSEQQANKTKAMAESRMRRLLQVRAEDKRLARARASKFRQVCDQSSQLLRDEIVGILEQQRQLELEAMRTQYEAALAGVAQGQRDAQQHAEQAARAQQQRRILLARREAEAQERFAKALGQVQQAKRSELEAFVQQLRLRRRILAEERGKVGVGGDRPHSVIRAPLQRAQFHTTAYRALTWADRPVYPAGAWLCGAGARSGACRGAAPGAAGC